MSASIQGKQPHINESSCGPGLSQKMFNIGKRGQNTAEFIKHFLRLIYCLINAVKFVSFIFDIDVYVYVKFELLSRYVMAAT